MQNDFADAVFWVHKGHVGCRKRQLEWMPVERDEKPVFVLTEGACFGESCLDEEPSRRVRAVGVWAHDGGAELISLAAPVLLGLGVSLSAVRAISAPSPAAPPPTSLSLSPSRDATPSPPRCRNLPAARRALLQSSRAQVCDGAG